MFLIQASRSKNYMNTSNTYPVWDFGIYLFLGVHTAEDPWLHAWNVEHPKRFRADELGLGQRVQGRCVARVKLASANCRVMEILESFQPSTLLNTKAEPHQTRRVNAPKRHLGFRGLRPIPLHLRKHPSICGTLLSMDKFSHHLRSLNYLEIWPTPVVQDCLNQQFVVMSLIEH